MIGAIVGDVIGSVYEWRPIKSEDFPLFDPSSRFTDDTVLTVATADALLSGDPFAAKYREWYRAYPERGYGERFRAWASCEDEPPYGSFGNGSAMRVSPVGWAFDDLEEVLEQARLSAAPTHGHPEGIKGAQAVAAAVFLARTGCSKSEVRDPLTSRFGYRLDRTVPEIREGYGFDVSCQGSVPEALVCFLESSDYEDAVRKAISLGGDADTQAAIAGAVAEAFYGGVPAALAREARSRLDARLLKIIDAFEGRHPSRCRSPLR